MPSKHLIAAVLLIIVIALGTGIYFTTKEKPEAQPLPTQLTVAPSEFTVPWENSVILTATLTSNGNPVEGENISWSVSPYWWGVVVSPNHSITDSSGQASFSFTVHYLYPVAPREEITFTITASFAGDNQYRGSTGNAFIDVTWENWPENWEIVPENWWAYRTRTIWWVPSENRENFWAEAVRLGLAKVYDGWELIMIENWKIILRELVENFGGEWHVV